MILKISPTPSLQGSARLPASKSYSIRAFLISACGGDSRILHPSDCDDAKVAMSVASALGATIKVLKPGHFSVKARSKRPSLLKVNVKESGTVLRLLLPLLSLYADKAVVVGEGTLRGRPNRFLTQALRQTGMNIRGSGASHCKSRIWFRNESMSSSFGLLVELIANAPHRDDVLRCAGIALQLLA